MTKKNLNLVRRSTNRGAQRSPSDVRKSSADRQDGGAFQPHDKRRRSDGDASDAESDSDGNRKLLFSDGDDHEWFPAATAVLKLLFSLRLSAALWSGISDCDEVYNYWEPLHLLLTGRGLQTWEYSPLYAIRSYLYVYLHHIPASLVAAILPDSKIAVFVMTRCVIGILTLAAEFSLYEAVRKRLGTSIARLFIVLSMLSTGMFISSTAFLPSSFSMAMNTLAAAAFLSRRWWLSILFTAISALVGWPFAAVLGLPVALHMLTTRRLVLRFIAYSVTIGIALSGILVAVDSYYYGRFVLAPLNIVLYNVLSGHGPELYGVEPASYYVKNLILNWNIAAPLALVAAPAFLAAFVLTWPLRSGGGYLQSLRKLRVDLLAEHFSRATPLALLWLSMAVWLAIFFSQPHKEERFLFPIYPLIALFAAVALESLCRIAMTTRARVSASSAQMTAWFAVAVFVVVSLSRSYSLHTNYSAPMESYRQLNYHLTGQTTGDPFSPLDLGRHKPNEPVRVCVGKEWHRFPSNFFLPSTISDKRGRTRRVQLDFVQSDFRGLLPKQWIGDGDNDTEPATRTERATRLVQLTRAIPAEMNDENKEEPGRYVTLDSCDYLVDLDTGRYTPREPNYKIMTDVFETLSTRSFLLADRSHPIWRLFYVPFVSERHCTYGTYLVLKRRLPKP